MSIAGRLWGGFAALVLVLLGLVAWHQVTLRDLASAQRQVADVAARAAVAGIEQVDHVERMRESAAKYAVTRDSGYVRLYRTHRDRYDAALAALDSLPLPPGVRSAVREARALRERLGPLSDVVATSDAAAVSFDDLRTASLAIGDEARAVIRTRAAEAAAAVARLERVSRYVFAGSLLLGFAVFGLAIRSITSSLRRLGDASHALAAGDFEHRIEGLSRDREFRRLEQDFNVMIGRLAEIDRLKADFLSGVSHDLKSPLASVREVLSLLLEQSAGPLTERQERLLNLGARSGERLSAMIDQLLDLARMDAGAARLRSEPADLAALAREVAQRTRPAPEDEAGIRVDVDAPAALPFTGDAGRITQVLENLLANAFRYAPEGSRIRLRVEAPESRPAEVPTDVWAEVVAGQTDGSAGGQAGRQADGQAGRHPLLASVEDEGPGVPEDLRASVFERFFQGPAAARAPGGVGLGLAICREIVRGHGGRIWVAERGGGGAAFRFLIPGGAVSDGAVNPAAGSPSGSREKEGAA